MNEAGFWKNRIKPMMERAGLHPLRVENSVHKGTPDVNFLHGWVELKYADEFPKRGGPLKFAHYTGQQWSWAEQRKKAGGRVYLLMGVGKETFLFRQSLATRKLFEDGLTREEAENLCIAHAKDPKRTGWVARRLKGLEDEEPSDD